MKIERNEISRLCDCAESRSTRHWAVAILVMFCVCGGVFAGETWDGSNLTIYGSADPTDVYVKRVENDTLSAGWIRIGTELGCASLVAVGSTINVSDSLYVGYEQNPGYTNTAASTTAVLTSSLFLTNSTLNIANNFTLGYGVQKKDGSIFAEIGPGSVVACSKIYCSCNPWPTLKFTGGRIVLDDSATSKYLCQVEGRTWNGSWVNPRVTFQGGGAPIDVEVQGDRKLAGAWGGRHLNLGGNGGFVKRGAGKLVWGWFTYGNTDAYVGLAVDYTGDTVIKAGGIELATPSSESKKQITYTTPSKSALKIEEGAWFDFAGNPASFLGVSGAGMITNSSATATTLTLGSNGGNGEYSPAAVGGSFDVVKLGTGTLTVGTTSIDGTLYVSNGTVKVSSGSTFVCGDIVAKAGTTLDVRGAHVTCGAFPDGKDVTVLKDAGTIIDCDVEMNEDDAWLASRLLGYGDMRKTGTGTLTLFGPSAKASGSVSIAQGAVVCKPTGSFAGKYYRINYYGDAGKSTSTGVSFSEFSIYDINGGRINEGTYTYNKLEPDPKQTSGGAGGIDDAKLLAEREIAVWMPDHNGFFSVRDGYSPAYIFDGNTATALLNTYYWARSNVLVFRVPDGSQAAAGFTFTTDAEPNRRPTQWKLEGSANGDDWTVLADNKTNTTDEATWTYLTNSTPATAKTEYRVQAIDKIAASSAYAPFGDAEVSVASGATLDFASVDMSLSRLAVDMDAGGGTITRFTPSACGTIDLRTSSDVANDSAIPLTVSEVATPKNFGSWIVKVNGEVRAGLKVCYRDGGLCLTSGGLMIFVR